MRRLQEKVRVFMKKEQQLTQKLNDVESRDENFMNRLETAVSFGKIMFMIRPSLQKSSKGLFSMLQQNYRKEFETLN